MNIYKTMMKHQNTFFSCANDVLSHHAIFEVRETNPGLTALFISGSFVASCNTSDREDMVLYYGNRETQRKINKNA